MISKIRKPTAALCAELSISADSSEIRNASDWVAKTCTDIGVPDADISRLDICLNEVLANIIDHGGEGTKQVPIYLRVDAVQEAVSNVLTVTVSDGGKPFNPIDYQQKARSTSLEDIELGGLGLTMIRKFVDDLSYDYQNQLNHLSFSVQWPRL